MPTNASTPHATTKIGSAVEIEVVAPSTLVTVGVSVSSLAVAGASRTSLAPRHQSLRSAPLIQYHGTGARRTATQIHTTPAHGPSTPRPWSS
jgi:hypothetical protein